MSLLSTSSSLPYLADTRVWVEKAVIGLNLCPFAHAVHNGGRIRWVVSDATREEELLRDLGDELRFLSAAKPEQIETTLLIHPFVLGGFVDYNQFLGTAEAMLAELELEGDIQLASFHPDYQFAGTEPDDVTNCTNRSPYPTLHLLRESSVTRAVEAFPEPEKIYEANIETLKQLGHAGWARLGIPQPPPGCPAHRRVD
jgi:hypothetical protein